MKNKEISYKDFSKKQLDNLKESYINSRVMSMSEKELRDFVLITITDQIKETVGNEEEKEAWKEMKDFFGNKFTKIIKEILQETDPLEEETTSEKRDLEQRLELLEQRKKESSNLNQDMW